MNSVLKKVRISPGCPIRYRWPHSIEVGVHEFAAGMAVSKKISNHF